MICHPASQLLLPRNWSKLGIDSHELHMMSPENSVAGYAYPTLYPILYPDISTISYYIPLYGWFNPAKKHKQKT
jgi:hypothetical protein